MKFKRHATVEDLLKKSVPESKELIDLVKKKYNENVIANCLFSLRNVKGKTQADMAKALNVTQSAVSKMENRGDCLSFNDFMRFVMALGCNVEVGIIENGSIRKRLEYHVERVNDILEEMAELAGDDEDINRGALETFRDVLKSISSKFLPNVISKMGLQKDTDPLTITISKASKKEDPLNKKTKKTVVKLHEKVTL